MVNLDFRAVARNFPLSVWSIYILGFILTFFNFFNLTQFNALLISSTITLFIFAPITEWEPSLKKTLIQFPFPLIVAYVMWFLSFVATKSPIPALEDHFILFLLPMLVGLTILILWRTVNEAFQAILIKFNKHKYWSGMATTLFLVGLGLLLIISFSLYSSTMSQTINATTGGV